MDQRLMLNKDGATFVGARAVVVPANMGTTGERPTRQTVVGQDRERFTLDDGRAYCRLTGVVWEKRYSVDRGTTLVRNAYTEGSVLFDSLWKSAADPTAPTAEALAATQEAVIADAVRAHRRVPPWARTDFYYDVHRARRALEAVDEDFGRIPAAQFWAILDRHRRPQAEIAGLTQPVGPDCLTGGHGTCDRCREVLAWARIAEHRWVRHGGDRAVRYDVAAILDALDRLDPRYERLAPATVFGILDEHSRVAPEATS